MPFAPKGPTGEVVFNEDRFDGRNIANGGNQVIVEIFAFAGKKLFHEGHAEALRDAAFDLAFDQGGVNGAADVVGGGQFQNFDGAEFEIDFDFGEMRAESVDGVGNALAVFVEGLGGRIVGGFGADDITALVERKFSQVDRICA